jgi:hypothetical protein
MTKNIKKRLVIIWRLTLLAAILLFGWSVLASPSPSDTFGLEPVGSNIVLGQQDIRVTIARIIRIALGLLGVVAVGITIYGGFLYMTASGVAEKVEKAKKLLIAAIIGLVIIISAFAITQFILNSLIAASGGGGAGGGGGGCTGPGCNEPGGYEEFCSNPTTAGSSAELNNPWLCINSATYPAPGQKGQYLTLYGGNVGENPGRIYFTDKDKTATYEAEIIKCLDSDPAWFKPISDSTLLKKVRIKVPDLLLGTAGNNYYIVVETESGQKTIDKVWTGVVDDDRKDRFALTNNTAYNGPLFICFLNDSDQEITSASFNQIVKLKGKQFGANEGSVKYAEVLTPEADVNPWTDELITTIVPKTSTGQVYLIRTDNAQDGDWLNILCETNDQCLSCCQQRRGRKLCQPESSCLGIAGQSCNDGASCTEVAFGCQPNLACDPADCTCKAGGVGAKCSSSATSCVPDDSKCGPDLYCATECTCQYNPVIIKVDPDNGKAGNFVTIIGRGFGDAITGNDNLIDNGDFENGSVGGLPTGWNRAAQDNSKVEISARQASSGSHSLLMHQDPNITYPGVCNEKTCTGKIPYKYAANCTWDAINKQCKFTDGGIFNENQNFTGNYENRTMWALSSFSLGGKNLTVNDKYLIKFKYKGTVGTSGNLRISITPDIGWASQTWYRSSDSLCNSSNCPTGTSHCYCSDPSYNTYYCCRNAPYQTRPYIAPMFFTPIKTGNYAEWTDYEIMFTYSSEMASWVDQNNKPKINLQFNFNYANTEEGSDLYLDDVEIVKVPTLGQVIFCQADADGNGDLCNDDDDLPALFPFETNNVCAFASCWQDNQVVIEIPPAAIDGPLKLVNLNGKIETTTDSDGWVGDFDVNNISRPAICGLKPTNVAQIGALIRVLGKNFGTAPQPLGLFIGGQSALNTLRSGTQTVRGQVPNVKPDVLPVQVKVGEEYSNPMDLKVIPATTAPVILSIDPTSGPKGQYVTIYGTNFGKQTGQVLFKNSAGNFVPADTDFPGQCANQYWHDGYVIVKVPSGLGTYTWPSYCQIKVKNSAGLESAPVYFDYCAISSATCPLRPGLCLLNPNQGPIDTKLNLYGDNFKTYSSPNSKVVFHDNKEGTVSAGNWTDSVIGAAAFSTAPALRVPLAAQTGPVKVVDKDLTVSNSLPFTVADCRENNAICDSANTGNICCERDGVCKNELACYGAAAPRCVYSWDFTTRELIVEDPPQVIEDIECLEDTQSPSPWLDSDNNCKNAAISARFTKVMDVNTFNSANIIVKKCNLETGTGFDSNSCSIWGDNLSITTIDSNTGFIIYPPAPGLAVNTWYEVTLIGGPDGLKSVASLGGFGLDGNRNKIVEDNDNYKWHFKVRNSEEECQLDRVLVTPVKATMDLITDSQEYNAFALAANCNILNPDSYNWNWYKVYSDGVQEPATPPSIGCTRHKCIAQITTNTKDGKVIWKQTATPLKQGRVFVAAQVANKKDDNNELVIDLNIPEITRIYPDNGLLHPDVDSYVTIYGYNFGEEQKDSRVLFDQALASLAPDCPTAWSDERIQVLVPKATTIKSEGKTLISQPRQTTSSGMVAFYDFEDSSNVVLSDKVNNNDGQIIGAERTNDQFGQALKFSGVCEASTKKCFNSNIACSGLTEDPVCQSYVKIPATNLKTLTKGSIELWFKPKTRFPTTQTLVSLTDGQATNVLSLEIVNDVADQGKLALGLIAKDKNSSVKSAILNIENDQWHHLVYTYDGQKFAIYLNGIKYYYFVSGSNLASYLGSAPSVNNQSSIGFLGDIAAPDNFIIGAQEHGSNLQNFYTGLIDGLAIYDRVLAEDEVWDHYGISKGQLLLLNFEETGDDILDSSGNNFTGLSVLDSANLQRVAGISGQAITGSRVQIQNYKALRFNNEFSLEGWFKIPDPSQPFTIYSADNMEMGNLSSCDAGVKFCLRLFLTEENNPANKGYKYVNLSLPGNSNYKADAWNYFAGVYNGQQLKVYLNGQSVSYEFPQTSNQGRIFQTTTLASNFSNAHLFGSTTSYGAFDNIALYNRALSDEEINSRLGAKNGSSVIVKTAFGEADSKEDSGQTFHHSDLVYPFLCNLTPNFGVEKTPFSISGNNFGDSNQTTYLGQVYDLVSLVNFGPNILDYDKVKAWSNKLLRAINPFRDANTPEIPVSISIDPLAEPFIDKNKDHAYNDDGTEIYADILDPRGTYNEGDYQVERFEEPGVIDVLPNLASNTVPFYLAPVITSITPNNGPNKQWVTIKGYNFGTYVEGRSQVRFYNEQVAAFPPAPCQNYWTNTQIIVVVPDQARSGDVYLVTEKGLTSNLVKFTVNNKPLGPGLCELSPSVAAEGTSISAKGDRFDEAGDGRGNDNIIFNNNKIAASFVWTNRNIVAEVPVGAIDGDVVVTKKQETGRKCAGFSIGAWCPSNSYNIIYEDTPSNPLNFNVYLPCSAGGSSQILTDKALTLGFPTGPIKNSAGLAVDTAVVATDGTYLYTRAATINQNVTNEDSIAGAAGINKLYRIGTGFNGTVRGKVYNEYTYVHNPSILVDINSTASMTYHSDGNLYLARNVDYIKPDNTIQYKVARVTFPDGKNGATWSFVFDTMPENFMSVYNADTWGWHRARITSNGTYIFNIGRLADGSGYRVKIFNPAGNPAWVKVKQFDILNNAEFPHDYYLNNIVADDNYLYLLPNTQGNYFADVQVIDWVNEKWLDHWPMHNSLEFSGQYDWVNNVFWFGDKFTGDHTIMTNRLYQYPACPRTGPGYCTTDADCQKCGVGTSSCQNGICSPYIVKFNPNKGPIGTWVNLWGCYFGCSSGIINFTDEKRGLIVPDKDCRGYWSCDTSFNNCDPLTGVNCDKVFVETPNRTTPTDLADDAISGPLTVITARGLTAQTATNFTVNSNELGQQICNLIPDYGNRGTTVRIHGEGFGESGGILANGDYVKFGLGNGLTAREPWSDLNNNGTREDNEPFIDFDNDGIFDWTGVGNNLVDSTYTFNISNYTPGAKKCPLDGWGEKDICFNIPATAGGQGSNALMAANNVQVFKNNDNNNQNEIFELTFGQCGNQVINVGESCDGISLPALTCTQLGWPADDACVLSCTNNCQLLGCDVLTGECHTITNPNCENPPGTIDPGEECDGDNLNSQDCNSLIPGSTGTLACYAKGTPNACKFDKSNCTLPPAVAGQPKVESVVPAHGSIDFCRNGIVDIYFDQQIATNTLNPQNLKLQVCTGTATVSQVKKGIVANVFSFVENLVSKLLGYQQTVLAENLNCDAYSDLANYTLNARNIYDRTLATLTPAGLLDPAKIYRVRISRNVSNLEGGLLDNTGTGVNDSSGDYIFDFMTLGTSGEAKSGICNVEAVDVRVYRSPFFETNPPLEDRESEIRINDLFICAGKDNCLLQADYDQDPDRAGNQHIYEAVAKYRAGYSIKASYQWSKTDQFDPLKAISLYGPADINPDDYKVKNDTGIIYVTAANIKEAVAKLVVEAQAEGSFATPAQQEFLVYTLLCENPWPSINEKFPISNIINAYNFELYYCRDAGRPSDTSDDLPAARWLFPQVTSLNNLENTDFEKGLLSPWVDLTGDAFIHQPVYSDITKLRPSVNISSNLQGSWWINTAENYQGKYWQSISDLPGQGNPPIGVMHSQGFLIEGDQLRFLVGGSQHDWPSSVANIVELDDPSYGSDISGVTAAVLGIKDDPALLNWKVAASATGQDLPQMREVTFDTSAYMTGRSCTSDSQCNGNGKCDCQGTCSAQNIGQCSAVTGIIYLYDNDTGGYISFDRLRQFKNGVEIPIRF